MQVYYSDHLRFPVPPEHRFPFAKYRLTRERLLADGILVENELTKSVPPPLAMVEAAHAPDYVRAVLTGSVEEKSWRRVGFPWSEALVERSLAAVGGTLAAAEAALVDGFGGNLAGGTHHAHRDRGEGYCIFNDIAIASTELLARGAVKRVAVVDLDVHQGNGNASMLGDDARVFLFSMHGAKNYPLVKVPSTLDVELPDGADDALFLARLEESLPAVLAFAPDLVFYQAGVDALAEDRLGRLSLTHAGLRRRDELVLGACRAYGIPVAVSLGGGYSVPIERTVAAHVATYAVAKELYR